MNALLILIGSVFCTITGQLLLKKGVSTMKEINFEMKTLLKTIYRIYTNHTILGGAAVFGIGTILWLIALSKFDLSYAYPFVSIGYVFVALFSRIFLKEIISMNRWLSILLIGIGVVLVSLS